MPRLTTLRVGPLADLAEQLRFAPPTAVLRSLRAAEELVDYIDPDSSYRLAWLVQRLTGYKPDPDADEHDIIIPGAALFAELSALAERLSDQARLGEQDVPHGSLTLPDLCRRWSVDRKTIERRRRRGLIARRVRLPDGRARLAFTPAAVERFERLDPRAASSEHFTRVDDATRERIIRRAERYRRSLGCTLNQAAVRLARRFNRSRETIRRILRAHDQSAHAPIFTDPGPIDARQRRVAHRAWRRGVSLGPIAATLSRSRATAQRAVNERRAELLRSLDLEVPFAPTFGRDDAAEVLLAPRCVSAGLGAPGETDALIFASLARAQRPVDEETESARAVAACYLRWSAALAIASLSRFDPPSATLDRIETSLRWAALLIIEQARSHQRLAILAIEEAAQRPLLDLAAEDIAALHTLAMDTILHAAATFDPFRPRPHRLAGAANVALARTLARRTPAVIAATRSRPGANGAAHRSHQRPVHLNDWTTRAAPWQPFLDPEPRVRAGLPLLDHVMRTLLERRHAWGADGVRPQTLEDLAQEWGATPARLAALERRARRIAAGLPPRAKARAAAPD